MTKKFIFIIISFFVLDILLFAQESSRVLIEDLQGDVQITRVGQVQGRAAAKEDVLQPNDKVQTGKQASAKIMVEGVGEITLGENTIWSYEKYVVGQEKRSFSAYLALGRLKAKVKKLPRDSSFEIKTPTSIAAVRGTFFGLLVYVLNQQLFTLLEAFEDSVVFSNLRREQSYTVEAGQRSTGDESGNVTPPEPKKSQTDQDISKDLTEEFELGKPERSGHGTFPSAPERKAKSDESRARENQKSSSNYS